MNEIEKYIEQFPDSTKLKLVEMYQIIKEVIPKDVTEKISWQMPTFYLNGNLVHFAAFKNHIGFYPGDSGVRNFEHKLANYKHSKGAIQFPIDKPLPKDLIQEIVTFRVKENINSK